MRIFFTKLGQIKRSLEWLPLLVVRVLIGTFLVFSGFFKLTSQELRHLITDALTRAHFPAPTFYTYLFPLLLILCGALLIIGMLTSLSSLILFALSITSLTVISRVDSLMTYKGATFLENLLYLPEALYALLFFWLFFSGPGKISFDYRYGRKKKEAPL